MEIGSTTNPVQTQTASTVASTQLKTDLDSFLLLLTAQITNQDPLEPMDSTTFVSQLAQLTQVEQSIETNSNLESISRQLASFNELSDVQLIGREVLVASETLDLNYGQATMQYQLFENADKVSIKILNESGSIIKEIVNLPTDAETKHKVIWDGLDSADQLVEDGAYRFEIEALDAESNQLSYSSYATTFVEEINFLNGLPILVLRNNDEVYSSAVLAVR